MGVFVLYAVIRCKNKKKNRCSKKCVHFMIDHIYLKGRIEKYLPGAASCGLFLERLKEKPPTKSRVYHGWLRCEQCLYWEQKLDRINQDRGD